MQPDDPVWSEDPKTGWRGWGVVKQTFTNETTHVAYLAHRPLKQQGRSEGHRVGISRDAGEGEEDGEPPSEEPAPAQTIRCTPGHPWWSEDRQTFAHTATFREGERLRLEDGSLSVVVSLVIKAERARTFNFEVAQGAHTYFVAERADQPAVLVHNTSTYLERQGIIFENAAQKAVRQSGASVITGTKVGKGGFDFLSFTGTGTNAQLTINEVKNELGRVSRGKFTALGLGSSGQRTLLRNIAQADRAILAAGLDPVTTAALRGQLLGTAGQANIRVIGSLGKETAVGASTARAIQRSVRGAQRALGAGSGLRLPRFGRIRIP